MFAVFKEFASELDGLDRIILNAGLGGAEYPIGTGGFAENKATMETNTIGLLAQAEASMEIFHAQQFGHLVIVSSFTGLRGMPGTVTSYAASKAAASSLAEGLHAGVMGTPIAVTSLMPGFIRTEMTTKVPGGWMMTGSEKGARAMVSAIETEKRRVFVPYWPWGPLSIVMRFAPMRFLRKIL